MAKEMVWIDLEMTGLDIEVESIIEIATIITDADLNIIAQGPNLAIKVSQELLEGMDTRVAQMLLLVFLQLDAQMRKIMCFKK